MNKKFQKNIKKSLTVIITIPFDTFPKYCVSNGLFQVLFYLRLWKNMRNLKHGIRSLQKQ